MNQTAGSQKGSSEIYTLPQGKEDELGRISENVSPYIATLDWLSATERQLVVLTGQ